MSETLAAIDRAGRIVLPKKVRDELAIHPGDVFKITVHGAEVTLRPRREVAGFVRKGRALVFASGGDSTLRHEVVEDIIAEEREAKAADLGRGLRGRKRQR